MPRNANKNKFTETHLIPLYVAAALFIFLIFEMIRRGWRKRTIQSCPSKTTPIPEIRIRLAHANNPRILNLLSALQQTGLGLTGDAYTDTQLLLSPGSIVCLRNSQGFLTPSADSRMTCEENETLGPAQQWIVEHSPLYCRQAKPGIRLRSKFTDQYLVLGGTATDDNGSRSTFLATPSCMVSSQGDMFSICLLELSSAERFHRSIPLDEKSKSVLRSDSVRGWQWSIIPLGSFRPSPAASISTSLTAPKLPVLKDKDTFKFSKLFNPLGV
jgi:hypothetical protein